MSTKPQPLNSSQPSIDSLLNASYPEKSTPQGPSKETCPLDLPIEARAEQIYHRTNALNHLTANSAKDPIRFGCSVITLLVGLSQIYSGGLVEGGIATIIGVKELYSQAY